MVPVRPAALVSHAHHSMASRTQERYPDHIRGSRLSPLERAIYSTLAYRDVFQFPLTISEIHRYLHGQTASREQIVEALFVGRLRKDHLDSDGEYFALRGRSEVFDTRRTREKMSMERWPTALRMAQFLGSLPNVRMVTITGSLAAGNFANGADIDFLLLADGGTMWRTRALCRFLALVEKRLGAGLFCPNVFLSAAQRKLTRQSIYDAQELCQMIPVYGQAEYEAIRRANAWTDHYLPNASGAPAGARETAPFALGLKRLSERVLNSPFGRSFEAFEAQRKIYRFNNTDRLKGAWTRSTPESHSLWDDMRLRVEAAWQLRMEVIAER